MKRIAAISIGFALLLACQIHGEILYRATFGYLISNNPINPDPQNVEYFTMHNWSSHFSNSSNIIAKPENDVDPFQTQSHGRFSLYLKDLDSTINYAMATSDTFHNDNDEYMIEFWFYHPGDGVKFYNGYPICRPLRITCGDTVQTDVQLWLKQDAFGIPMTHIIAQTQAETLYVDFTLIADHWVKLQLHRHDGQVDIYVMSELKGTLAADNPTQKTNCLRIGTAEPQYQGEAYWDDFIVTTVPQGVHPRLWESGCLTGSIPFLPEVPSFKDISCQQQWGRHQKRVTTYYATIDNSRGTMKMAMVYDHRFKGMGNYDKMNTQNAILTLGCQQLLYEFKGQADLMTAVKSALGFAALALDPVNQEYLQQAAASLKRNLAVPRNEGEMPNVADVRRVARQCWDLFLSSSGNGILNSLSSAVTTKSAPPWQ